MERKQIPWQLVVAVNIIVIALNFPLFFQSWMIAVSAAVTAAGFVLVPRTIKLWYIAVLITAASAVYQRMTGPTYPKSGKVTLANHDIKYKLDRSWTNSSDYLLQIKTGDTAICGLIEWKRFKSNDSITRTAMKRHHDTLYAELPKQPSAGKLQYRIQLSKGTEFIWLTDEPVVMRFKDPVPLWLLIPHVFCMFLMLAYSTRTGLEMFNPQPHYKDLTLITLCFFIAGGMILGPLVQLYAFGALWTGWPFGHDLTDNKTLVALIVWIIALVKARRSSDPKKWIIGAALATFIVFLIPHSVLGSELDYTKK
jgi:hypothetical protein